MFSNLSKNESVFKQRQSISYSISEIPLFIKYFCIFLKIILKKLILVDLALSM